MSGFLDFSVVNDAAGLFFFVRLEANAVCGLPGQSNLFLDCCSLDDSDYKVIVEDASVFDLEVNWLFEGKRSGDWYAMPIVQGLLEDLSLCSFCALVALHHDAVGIVFESKHFWLVGKCAS